MSTALQALYAVGMALGLVLFALLVALGAFLIITSWGVVVMRRSM